MSAEHPDEPAESVRFTAPTGTERTGSGLLGMGGSTVGLIAARSDSSRLPRKALTPVEGRPLVGWVIERAKRIEGLRGLALATTDRAVDDELAEYAASCGIAVCRGDATDVVKRLLECSEPFGASYILRLNGDTPFLDPELIGEGVRRAPEGYDLISNIVGRTFPYGVSVEIISREALELAHPHMTPEEREHVTQRFYQHPDEYRICTLTSDSPELARARMVVDTKGDLDAFEAVVRALGESALTAGHREAASCYLDIGWTQS